MIMEYVGKKAGGRVLDGQTYDAMPPARTSLRIVAA